MASDKLSIEQQQAIESLVKRIKKRITDPIVEESLVTYREHPELLISWEFEIIPSIRAQEH